MRFSILLVALVGGLALAYSIGFLAELGSFMSWIPDFGCCTYEHHAIGESPWEDVGGGWVVILILGLALLLGRKS